MDGAADRRGEVGAGGSGAMGGRSIVVLRGAKETVEDDEDEDGG